MYLFIKDAVWYAQAYELIITKMNTQMLPKGSW